MRIHTPILGATLAAAVALSLPATSAAQPPPPAPESDQCPDYVRGAKLSVRQIDGGVSFEITTGNAGYVSDLRQMLRELAAIVEHHTRAMAADPQPLEEGAVEIPPVDISLKDIPGGVLVTVRAQEVTNVGLVRHQARGIEKLWATSRCINSQSRLPAARSIRL
jgi:hypothetical protein